MNLGGWNGFSTTYAKVAINILFEIKKLKKNIPSECFLATIFFLQEEVYNHLDPLSPIVIILLMITKHGRGSCFT